MVQGFEPGRLAKFPGRSQLNKMRSKARIHKAPRKTRYSGRINSRLRRFWTQQDQTARVSYYMEGKLKGAGMGATQSHMYMQWGVGGLSWWWSSSMMRGLGGQGDPINVGSLCMRGGSPFWGSSLEGIPFKGGAFWGSSLEGIPFKGGAF